METFLGLFTQDDVHPIFYLCVLLFLLGVGEVISLKTNALIPSLLVFALLILVTSWTGLIPKDIVALAGIDKTISAVLSLLMIANMGTTINIEDIRKNWDVAIVALSALLGAATFVLIFVSILFGNKLAFLAAPVAGGGIVAAIEMQDVAMKVGGPSFVSLVMFLVLLHSFPGFISVPYFLKKTMIKDLNLKKIQKTQEENDQVKEVIKIPLKYQSNIMLLTIIAFICALSVFSSILFTFTLGQILNIFKIKSTFVLSPTIFVLLYSILVTHFKLLPQNTLEKANASGLVVNFVIIGALGSLTLISPYELIELLIPIISIIIISGCGIVVFATIVGRIFKFDNAKSIAIGLNCFLGFPINYMITLEAINSIANSEAEKTYLKKTYLPIMIVAGFVSITLGSVFLASIFKNFI